MHIIHPWTKKHWCRLLLMKYRWTVQQFPHCCDYWILSARPKEGINAGNLNSPSLLFLLKDGGNSWLLWKRCGRSVCPIQGQKRTALSLMCAKLCLLTQPNGKHIVMFYFPFFLSILPLQTLTHIPTALAPACPYMENGENDECFL